MNKIEFKKNTGIFLGITIAGGIVFGTVGGRLVQLFSQMFLSSLVSGFREFVYDEYEFVGTLTSILIGSLPVTMLFLMGAIAVLAYKFYIMYSAVEGYNNLCQKKTDIANLSTHNYFLVFFLSWIVPFGIYRIIWFYKQGNNLQEIARRYKKNLNVSGKSYLMMLLVPAVIQWVLRFIILIIYVMMLAGASSSYYGYNINKMAGQLLSIIILFIISSLVGVVRVSVMGNVVCASYVKNAYMLMDSIENSVEENGDLFKTHTNDDDRKKKNEDEPTHMVGSVQILTGQYKGAIISIKEGEEVFLGRDGTKCNLIFENPHVSRVHCSVRFQARTNQYIITDYSANGTFNKGGRQFVKNQPTPCARNTVIMLGRSGEEFIVR